MNLNHINVQNSNPAANNRSTSTCTLPLVVYPNPQRPNLTLRVGAEPLRAKPSHAVDDDLATDVDAWAVSVPTPIWAAAPSDVCNTSIASDLSSCDGRGETSRASRAALRTDGDRVLSATSCDTGSDAFTRILARRYENPDQEGSGHCLIATDVHIAFIHTSSHLEVFGGTLVLNGWATSVVTQSVTGLVSQRPCVAHRLRRAPEDGVED